ncbi:BsuPI-related putative proteinase inhibitor [Bacillus carboniphilus]|uniref:Intracellular proteinase inhibitor BsuPI domain-containing protein n=1 Tax=Bacillus carboniphilus TaxID=86663 RepID=A0ABY9JU41_9BACI|nr:BsuPI-related putative proteinase inhibitor [Bacillus carboniphilus]WLR42924.1 BsuPI-related putative proteinase inhibitor [Bacillus carboniphilus]
MKLKMSILAVFLLILTSCGQDQLNNKEVASEVSEEKMLWIVEIEPGSNEVTFQMKLTNNTSAEQIVKFNSGQSYDIVVRDSTGKEVYRYSKGRMFTQALREITIASGDTKTWESTWDYKKDGTRVEEGTYQVTTELKGVVSEGGKLIVTGEFVVPSE